MIEEDSGRERKSEEKIVREEERGKGKKITYERRIKRMEY